MNYLKSIAIACILGVMSLNVLAQDLSKAEKKALKKEIKTYKKDPKSYQDMKDLNKKTVDERDQTIVNLTAQIDELNAKNMRMSDSINSMNRRIQSLQYKLQNISAVPEGTVYAVQVGYYKMLDLEGFNKIPRIIKAEEIDGAKRYVIGYFTDLKGAVQFGEDIKKIGINDAFVSQYVNGKRNMGFDALKIK